MIPPDTLTPEELAAANAPDDDDLDLEALRRIAEPDPAEPQDLVPAYVAAAPTDLDARAAHVAEATAELARMFRSGEIEFDDFEAQRDQLLREREALTIARTKAEISQEMQAQGAERQWRNTVDKFLSTTELDYRNDPKLMDDLDAYVRHLASKPENAGRPMDWFLSKAHLAVQALHGHAARDAGGARDDDRVHRDVANLTGYDLEDEIARMTPAQREQWLRR
jgi:hypothetical protein